MDNKRFFFLTLANIPFLKGPERLVLANHFDKASDLLALKKREIEAHIKRKLRAEWRPGRYVEKAELDREVLLKMRIGMASYYDLEYPPQLREIYAPPFLLFYRGVLPDYHKPLAGVVGTRQPTLKALRASYAMGLNLARYGVGVVSGLALGIDAAAHQGQVDGNGATVAVLACGIDSVYPARHRSLSRSILDNRGTIFSEYPPGVAPLKYNFPARNRIISGLARSVLIVQAPRKSGALITADYALDQGRELYVHRAGLGGNSGAGGDELRLSGAKVVQTAEDILEEWDTAIPLKPREPAISHLFENQPVGKAMASLLQMELSGEVVRRNGEYFRRAFPDE